MQLYALLPAMEAKRTLRTAMTLPDPSLKLIRSLAIDAFGDTRVADRLVTKIAEEQMRAGLTPDL